MRCVTLVLSIILTMSCQDNNDLYVKIKTLENENRELYHELKACYNPSKKSISHIVLFDVKETLTKEETLTLKESIQSLSKISEVLKLEFGEFINLKDQRALDQYEYILTLAFRSEEDYNLYQDHPIHKNLKAQLNNYLAGPPATYDYK